MDKRWWIVIGAGAGLYLGVAFAGLGPLRRQPPPKKPAKGFLYQSTGATPAVLLGIDERDGLIISEKAGWLRYDRSWNEPLSTGSISHGIAVSGTAVFADGTEDDRLVVVTDDYRIMVADPDTGSAFPSQALTTGRTKPSSASTLAGFGLSFVSDEAWVQNGREVEVWGNPPGRALTKGVKLPLPPVRAFSVSLRAPWLCYAEEGTKVVSRRSLGSSIAHAAAVDTVDFGEQVVAVAMADDSRDFFALTVSGKLYFYGGAKKLLADLKGEDEGNGWTLKVNHRHMMCFDGSTLVTSGAAMPVAGTKTITGLTGGAISFVGPVISTKRGNVSTVDFPRAPSKVGP